MPVFNYPGKEVNIKVVYYGPGLSGKTTNIQYIHDNIRPDFKGKLVSLATQTDRTLFFDFLPMDLGMLGGYKIRLHLYTVPGQVHYNATRKLVLKGVDGVVLVADSQRAMQEANQESLKNLEKNLESYGKDLSDLPHVIQCNKRDLDDLLSVDELKAQLDPYDAPILEVVASEGEGVLECLREILRLVMKSLRDQFPPDGRVEEPVDEASPVEAETGVETQPPDGPVPEPKPEPQYEEELSPEPAVEPDESEVILNVPEEEIPQIPETDATTAMETPELEVVTGADNVTLHLAIPGGGKVEVALQVKARLINAPVSGEAVSPVAGEVFEEEGLEETPSEIGAAVPEPVNDDPGKTAPEADEELPPEEIDLGELIAELEEEKETDSLEIEPGKGGDQAAEGEITRPAPETPDEPYDPSFKELRFTDFDGDKEPEGGKGKRKGFFGRLRKKK